MRCSAEMLFVLNRSVAAAAIASTRGNPTRHCVLQARTRAGATPAVGVSESTLSTRYDDTCSSSVLGASDMIAPGSEGQLMRADSTLAKRSSAQLRSIPIRTFPKLGERRRAHASARLACAASLQITKVNARRLSASGFPTMASMQCFASRQSVMSTKGVVCTWSSQPMNLLAFRKHTNRAAAGSTALVSKRRNSELSSLNVRSWHQTKRQTQGLHSSTPLCDFR
mmetsp:Transcript_56568/g.131843  ORF Transcript_56568/g.131843 Transcript_56568/m.131843 type:complete len:225 (-) Transcript_56568:28-702(-)